MLLLITWKEARKRIIEWFLETPVGSQHFIALIAGVRMSKGARGEKGRTKTEMTRVPRPYF